MKIENQVVNRKLAIQLKNLDVKQDSYWKWENYSKNAYWYVKEWQLTESSCLDDEVNVIGLRNPKDYEIYSAFTVAELGEMLPEGYYSQKEMNSWACADADNHLAVTNIYDCDNIYTEADVRAKMLICLIKNKSGLVK